MYEAESEKVVKDPTQKKFPPIEFVGDRGASYGPLPESVQEYLRKPKGFFSQLYREEKRLQKKNEEEKQIKEKIKTFPQKTQKTVPKESEEPIAA